MVKTSYIKIIQDSKTVEMWYKTQIEIIITYQKIKKPQSGLISNIILRIHIFFN